MGPPMAGRLNQGLPGPGPPDLGPPDLGPPDLGPPDLGPLLPWRARITGPGSGGGIGMGAGCAACWPRPESPCTGAGRSVSMS
jgi:hypothetical protein